MKRFMKRMITSLICFILFANGSILNVSASASDISADEFLLLTGMSRKEINQLDPEIKEFMVSDMKRSADTSDLSYIDSDPEIVFRPMVNQVLTGIVFSAPSFISSSTIYIYPTYEFTTPKEPDGEDSFSFQLGDAMRPYEYGGQVWYKDSGMSSWAVGDSMTANTQGFNGAEYSGSQLGTPDWPLLIKGCAYCHADVGTGTDKRIVLSYMYNPNSNSYSISFSAYGLGISYSSSNTIYTNASTIRLTY